MRDSEKPRRRSIRLRHYDYTSAAAYFVTICAFQRQCRFGEVVDGEMRLNEAGLEVRDEWLRTPTVRAHVALDEFVVMPNHVHGIIVIHDVGATRWVARDDHRPPENRASQRLAPTVGLVRGSLGAIIGQFKSAVTKCINQQPGAPVWQRNYYERVIRNDRELHAIREYIVDNPVNWAEDEHHPTRL